MDILTTVINATLIYGLGAALTMLLSLLGDNFDDPDIKDMLIAWPVLLVGLVGESFIKAFKHVVKSWR